MKLIIEGNEATITLDKVESLEVIRMMLIEINMYKHQHFTDYLKNKLGEFYTDLFNIYDYRFDSINETYEGEGYNITFSGVEIKLIR